MGSDSIPFDEASAEALLMRFLAVDGVTGHEAAIAAEVSAALVEVGVPPSTIKYDEAHQRIPLPTETGNLIATLPGTRPGPRLLFSTHLDTVPLCAGANPKREGERIVNQTAGAALGGDNRTGCAVLVAMVETLLKHDLPHPPITLLFTVREESGLHGARELDPADLGGAAMGFNVDAQVPANLVIGAVGQVNWQAEIRGKASHAGVAPEKGISSTLVASIALAEAHRNGWFGKIDRTEGKGTSNPGIFEGEAGASAGDATNVVTDYVHIVGEARSFDEKFAAQIATAYEAAFEAGRLAVADSEGNHAQVKFTAKPSYPPFQLPEDSPAVERAKRAAETLGLPAATLHSNGGLDANWLVRHGVPAVTIGAGQHEIHTVNEFVDLPQFFDGCRLAIALATLDD